MSAGRLARAGVPALLLVVVTTGTWACSDDTKEPTYPPAVVRPAHVINEQKEHDTVRVDDPWNAETPTVFRTVDVLPDLEVVAILIHADQVYLGTPSGIYRLAADGARFELLLASGPTIDFATLDDGGFVAARLDGVDVFAADGSAVAQWQLDPGQEATSVASAGGEVFMGMSTGLVRIDGAGTQTLAQGFEVRDAAPFAGVLWLATEGAIRRYDLLTATLLDDLRPPDLVPDDDVRALAVSGSGETMFAATATGLAEIAPDGATANVTLAAIGGLPTGDLRAITSSGSEVMIGHGIGASFIAPDHTDHYHTERWIPSEAVTAVALGPDGNRWIGTEAGVSRISLQPQTLAAKAGLFEPMVDDYIRMDGFVDDNPYYADPYLLTAPVLTDNDNDGLWTEVQIAAWCFAYASTNDADYREKARQSLDVMLLQIDIPGETFAEQGFDRGFITRSLVREDEGFVFDDKLSQENWHEQVFEGKTYYWKDDTSSDEYAGHFFGLPIYYDLCADEADRARIRERVALVMDYVIAGNYELVDLGGEPTKHGRWKNLAVAVDGDLGACLAAGHPECIESWGGGGWLNSIEILGHLLAAWHITGNDRYYDEYERLAIEERYAELVPLTDHTLTVTSRDTANHSDHELATLAYFTLLRYEPNADRRTVWQQSLRDFLKIEELERNALEVAVAASALGDGVAVDDGLRTLREMPTDWREWSYDNSHRLDVMVDPVLDRFDDLQFTTVLPHDEIRTMKWNGNPFVVTGGGDGHRVQGPWPFLLPYWMMRYYGVVRLQ